MERSRDLIEGEITLDYFLKKAADGWKLSAIEWVRDTTRRGETTGTATGTELRFASQQGALSSEVPYALQIAADGSHLEDNPLERTVLILILQKIVREKRVTQIAIELNAAGYRTRKGVPWTPSDVFNLLPRVIEAGPDLLRSPEWEQQHLGSPHTN